MTFRRIGDPSLTAAGTQIFTLAGADIYKRSVYLQPGVYVVTSNTGLLYIAFYDAAGNVLASGGTGTYTINEYVSTIAFESNTTMSVTLTYSRSFSTDQITGTVVSYTTTQNITNNNRAQVLIMGGGGGGASGAAPFRGGSGGGSGTINATQVFIGPGTYPIVIGAGGPGGIGSPGGGGGTTIFNTNLIAPGGNGGTRGTPAGQGFAGSGGSGGGGGGSFVPPATNYGYLQTGSGGGANGGSGGGNFAGAGSGVALKSRFATAGSGGSAGPGAAGGGGGLYAGGGGGSVTPTAAAGGNATGFGGGGGGATSNSGTGGSGQPGVVYLLEWS